MATILYYSDIHLEIREQQGGVRWTSVSPLGLGPDLRAWVGRADLLVLAGDIGRMRSRRKVSTLDYAAQAADFLGCPALVVPGNHEYYRGSFDDERDALLAADVAGVTVLDRGEAAFAIDGRVLRVLGATLWTDYAANGDRLEAMRRAQAAIEDHRLIVRRGGAPFLPEDALDEHLRSRAWLAERLAEPHAGPTIIVTHHVPHSTARNPKFGVTPLSPAFHSDCDELIDAAARAQVAAWIFGHHHGCHAVDCRGVRLLSAQLGYPGEATGWLGPGLLEL